MVSPKHTELKFIIDDKLYEDLEVFKNLISHKNPNPSYAELLTELVAIALKTLRPKLPAAPQVQKDTGEIKIKIKTKAEPSKEIRFSRYIPAKLKKVVLPRDNGRCTFIDSVTKRRCNSTFQIQFHHEQPFAKGGEHTEENIRLLCRQHNMQTAIKDFGKEKMQKFMHL